MVLVGRRSDRTGERHLHLALPALAGGLGFLATSRAGSTGLLVAAMSLTAFGVLGWLGPFWALPTAFLREQAAAGGIALINSMGAVGGFVGPYLIGEIKDGPGRSRRDCWSGWVVGRASLIVLALRAARRFRPRSGDRALGRAGHVPGLPGSSRLVAVVIRPLASHPRNSKCAGFSARPPVMNGPSGCAKVWATTRSATTAAVSHLPTLM
jgi:MFS family permease